MEPIELDGSQGEGGGQILRSALSLSMITGKPFVIERIRARRARPGLLRQHLTAVLAAAEISQAQLRGAELGSSTLRFQPGPVRGGEYRFAIGTAGSCTLVLQTLLPALWFADAPSRVSIRGGTHNQAAPTADFLIHSWLPLMRRMGVHDTLTLLRHGFYPAGGGEIEACIEPVGALRPLVLDAPGELVSMQARVLLAGVAGDVARRELGRLRERLGPLEGRIEALPACEGPGNVLSVERTHAGLSLLFTAIGTKGVSAEKVADQASEAVLRHARSGAAVEEHLADQLVLPMALAGGGRFSTSTLSSHLRTQCAVIGRFLGVDFTFTPMQGVVVVGVGELAG